MSTHNRLHFVDLYRGIAIILMVIFALNWKLTHDLPSFLRHNDREALHLGDFVLPLFLFASGMSLAISSRRSERCLLTKPSFWKRIALQLAISLVMTPFIGHSFLAMDELMLNAMLSVPCALLLTLGTTPMVIASCSTMVLYVVLSLLDLLPLTGSYLGGYGAAIFYLPIMLTGAATLIDEGGTQKRIVGWGALFAATVFLIPPRKLLVTPSFFALANVVCLTVFLVLKHRQHSFIEYLGQRPLRIWILLGGVVASINLYESHSRTLSKVCELLHLPEPHTLNINWIIATFVIAVALFSFAQLSRVIDGLKTR